MSDSPEFKSPRFKLPHWKWCLLGALMLLGITVIPGVVLPHQRKQAAVNAIHSVGRQFEIIQRGPNRLRKMFGGDFDDFELGPLDHVVEVYLPFCDIDDAFLLHLMDLPELKRVHIWEAPITAKGTQHLVRLVFPRKSRQ